MVPGSVLEPRAAQEPPGSPRGPRFWSISTSIFDGFPNEMSCLIKRFEMDFRSKSPTEVDFAIVNFLRKSPGKVDFAIL